MPEPRPQDLRHHARYVPGYHFVLAPLLVMILFHAGRRLWRRPDEDALFALGVGVALLILYFYARQFALTVQDRVIRLEMRLRLRELLPPERMARFDRFTPAQLVALRFAGDGELPELACEVLEGRVVEPAEIKRRIRDWQPDHQRA